jgi:hypothetical protein
MIDLPDFVLDSYKRYKDETQKVVTWLGETACAYTPQVSQQTSNVKKKSRKKAPEPVTKIPLQEFATLAQTIFDASPPVQVRRGILHSLRKVIAK